jgi:hypothetical protein
MAAVGFEPSFSRVPRFSFIEIRAPWPGFSDTSVTLPTLTPAISTLETVGWIL